VKNKLKYFLIGAGIVLLAVCVLLLHILAPDYLNNFLVFSVGFAACWLAVSNVKDTYSCKEKVSAVLVDYGLGRFKAHLHSYPSFKFRYKGKIYTSSATDCSSPRYVFKHYKKWNTYTIYVCPENPALIRMERKLRFSDIALFLFGLTFMFLSVWAIFLTK
jgi:hypothetical protein